MRLFAVLGTGALLGAAASFLQLELFRYGALGGSQLPLFALAYVALGMALAGLGAGIAAVLGRQMQAGFLLALAGFAVLLPLNRRDLPDVYLLVTDTTRADHLSLYGYERETTPFLERFAEQGVVFENSVSQGSHTIVSTPSLLTSTYPSEHGMRRYVDVLPQSFVLVSEYLRDEGYATFGYATNPHLGPVNGFDQGFDVYAHDPRWRATPAAKVNAQLLSWLDAGGARPIFAFLFYIDPHSPYAPPRPYQELFDSEWKGKPLARWNRDWPSPRGKDAELRNLVAQYDGSIAYWDAELEKFVAELESRGRLGDALFIYTSDHGEEFFEHGNWGHNRTLFEESIRVPLLISLPVPVYFPPLPRVSGRVDEVVSGVDVLPTLLEYLRIEADPRIRGRSALPLLLGTGRPRPRTLRLLRGDPRAVRPLRRPRNPDPHPQVRQHSQLRGRRAPPRPPLRPRGRRHREAEPARHRRGDRRRPPRPARREAPRDGQGPDPPARPRPRRRRGARTPPRSRLSRGLTLRSFRVHGSRRGA